MGWLYPIAMDPMEELLNRLADSGIPIGEPLRESMMQIDIRHFSDLDPTPFFHDMPLVFMTTKSGGVKTVSAPHMVATMLHHLELSHGQDVVIIGSKGGYVSALIGQLVGPEGSVLVLDPSEEVVEHTNYRLIDYSNCSVELLDNLDTVPSSLSSNLNRILVTGSLLKIPEWLESRIVEGGFMIAPIGTEFKQNLIKREIQDGSAQDTNLGPVVFGPIDIEDARPTFPSPNTLADLLVMAVEFGQENQLINDELQQRMNDLVANLRHLPDDLLPPFNDLDTNLDDCDVELDNLFQFDNDFKTIDNDISEIDIHNHPLLKLLDEEAELLMQIWPLLAMLNGNMIQQPGAPDSKEHYGGSSSLGGHEDLVP